jgi:16S rRNA (adenine1518-N6/adenine1519-N6)-dimethyltransferase
VNEDILKFKITDHPFLLPDPLTSPLAEGRPTANLKWKNYKLVANIPYYITSPLIKHFLHSANPPELMVLLVQKEVAEKICGKGGKTLLTVEVEVFGEPELIAKVPANAFYPAPKVDSAILRIRPHAKPLVSTNQQKAFFRLVKFGYSQKRKKLSNTLGAGLHLKPSDVAEKMRSIDIDPNLRAEHLGVEEWKKLTDLFK